MSNIFADCLRHAFSYLTEGGGDPPDPGGGGGGGCEGQDNCNDEGDSICDETFTIVKCVCLANGNPITDGGECDQEWSCVEEGTTATDLENDVEACDTFCEGWTGLPNNGENVCGFPVVTPGTNAECNLIGCGSQQCVFFKCENDYAYTTNECIISRTIWISNTDECQSHIQENEFLNSDCVDASQPEGCPTVDPGDDTKSCDYYYCLENVSNCDQTFSIEIPIGQDCPATQPAEIQGTSVVGYASPITCLNSETGCQGDYDGPTPNFVTFINDSFPGMFSNQAPDFICDGDPINFVDPDWGLINFPDEDGEIFNIKDFTFTPVDSQGNAISNISFNLNGDSATISFNPGAGNDASFNNFTFNVQGNGVNETLIFTDPPAVNSKNCDNYPAQCASLGQCGYTYQNGDPVGGVGGGNVGGNAAYKCVPPAGWTGTGDWSCEDTGTSNTGDSDEQNGVGFGAVFFGSCPTDKCEVQPYTFYACEKEQLIGGGAPVNTGNVESKVIYLPSYIYNDVNSITIAGKVWKKTVPSCPPGLYECAVYRCDDTEGCVQTSVNVATEADCEGTIVVDGQDYQPGDCTTGPCDTVDLNCDAYQCAGSQCNTTFQLVFGAAQGTTCEDLEGQDIDGTGVIIGSCDSNPCDTTSQCDISYCDESNNCQTTQANISDLYDPAQGGIGFTSCPADGQNCIWIPDANTNIGAIGGTSCPQQCNTQPTPPPPGGPDKSNIQERLRRLSDGELQQRANNFLATLERLNTREGILDSVGSNRTYFERTSFVPVRNNLRTDIFADYIHCSIAEIINKRETSDIIPNSAYSNLGLIPLFQSLRRDIRYRLETVKDSRGVPIKNGFLRALKRAIMFNTLDSIRADTIPEEGYDVDKINLSKTRDEKGLVDFINKYAKPIDPSFYTGKNKERMRLWKSPATDLRKAVPLLYKDGTIDYSDVSLQETFNIVLADSTLSTLSIQVGDIVKYEDKNGRTNAVDLESDKPKAFMLDRGDYARAFAFLGDDLTTKIEVESPESALIEETYSLDQARQDVYFLKINLSSVEELDSDKKLIRYSKVQYDWVENDEDIDEFVRYNPWPFENYYIAPEDPFFDHLEYSKKVHVTFKDISFENLVGYRDDSIIMPRRMPWYIQIIPSDDPKYLLSEGKTFLSGYSKRFIHTKYHPYKVEKETKFKPSFLNQFDQEQRGEGFDPRDNYVGTLRFGYNKTRFKEIDKPLLNGEESLPRKETPVRKLLKAIKDVKDTSGSFIDEDNSFIPWPEVYKKMSVEDIQSLKFFEFDSWEEKENTIANNNLATESSIKSRYSKLSDVPKEDLKNYDDYVKPEVRTRATSISPDFQEETPEPLP